VLSDRGSGRLAQGQPVFPHLGMEMLAGELDAQLIRSGEQLARHADEKDSNRLRLPALERGVATQKRHPAGGVVGQYGTLEQRGVGQKVVGL
jgi:hypothetical protein